MEKLLCDMRRGESGRICRLSLRGPMRGRLQELGFVPGMQVTCLYVSAFGDPTAYGLQDTVIALRRRDAAGVWVVI